MNSGEISRLRPFGRTLYYGLDNAKIDPKDGYALWIEEDYCTPPLAMERESILDRYFEDITVQLIASEKEGGEFVARVFNFDKDHFLPITSPIPLALQIFDSISDIDNNIIQY